MKKILIIGTTERQGGAAKVGWNIGKELVSRGYDVKYLVGYRKSTNLNVEELSKPKITSYLDRHTKYDFTSLLRYLRSFITSNDIDFGASQEILTHPWYRKADLVHIHNLHGNYFKLDTLVQISRSKPVVWTLHDMWPITGKCAYTSHPEIWKDGYQACGSLLSYPPMLWDNTKYLWKRKNFIYKRLSNITIVTPSDWLASIVRRSMLKVHPLRTIHNGIDTGIFKPTNSSIRHQLGIKKNAKIILFIAQGGSRDPRKGYRYIEEIRKKFLHDSNIVFIALGGGKKVVKHQNVISIPFEDSPTKLSQYYAASDMLLFPSLAENCPLVVLEALSVGLPIVSFDTGGVKELVKHRQGGYIAKYKNSLDLKNGVNWILSLSKSKIGSMRIANRKRACQKFSVSKMVDMYEKLYKNYV